MTSIYNRRVISAWTRHAVKTGMIILAFTLLRFTVNCPLAHAQNTVALFPCFGGKAVAGACPAVPGTPPGFSPLISKDDYYDVYVESICINQPDSWWRKKLVHVEVTVKTGTVNQTIPVYAERAGSECRIGVANYPLLTSIPANGNRLTLAAHVYRSSEQDGMNQILTFMVGQQKNTVLNTYASAAVPYLTAIGDVASEVYKSFAPDSQDYQDFKDTDLVPTGPVASTFDLKDEYIVFYAGPNLLQSSDVYLDSSSSLRSIKNDSVISDKSTWIVFRIQKRQHRLDYPQRPWYTDWEQLVRQVKTRDVDSATVQKRIGTENTLLNADADYTNGDKDYYSDIFIRSEVEMINYLSSPTATPAQYDTAIANSSVTPAVAGTTTASGVLVTATTTTKPVAGDFTNQKPVVEQWRPLDPTGLSKTIVPAQFLMELKKVNTGAVPH